MPKKLVSQDPKQYLSEAREHLTEFGLDPWEWQQESDTLGADGWRCMKFVNSLSSFSEHYRLLVCWFAPGFLPPPSDIPF